MRLKLLSVLLVAVAACSGDSTDLGAGEPQLPTLAFPNGKVVSDTISGAIPSAVVFTVLDSLGRPIANTRITVEVHALSADRPFAGLVNEAGDEVAAIAAMSADGTFAVDLRLAPDTATGFVVIRLEDHPVADSVLVRVVPGQAESFRLTFDSANVYILPAQALQFGQSAEVLVLGCDRRNNITTAPAVAFAAADPAVASVNASGVVTARDFGSVIVRATGASGTDSVLVHSVPAADIIGMQPPSRASFCPSGVCSADTFFGTLDGRVLAELDSDLAGAQWINRNELVLQNLTVADTTGRIIRSLVPSGQNVSDPMVADTAIYYRYRLVSGNEEIWRVRPSGEGRAKVMDRPMEGSRFAVNREGTMLFYNAYIGSGYELIRVDMRTKASTNLGIRANKFALSPDGRTIAYTTEADRHVVHLADTDGRPIGQFEVPAALWMQRIDSLVWSHDGRYLLIYHHSGQYVVGPYIRDMSTGREVLWTDGPTGIAWRPASQ